MPPDAGDDWIGLTDQPLPIGVAYDWSVVPGCGAVVLFSGTVRDHAEGRDDVASLTYEAYENQVEPVFATIVDEVRTRWPRTGRIVLLHRTGRLELTESSVVAVASAPHRPEAFEAARYAIDALKASAPIWKHEVWADGADWGTGAHDASDPRSVPTDSSARSDLHSGLQTGPETGLDDAVSNRSARLADETAGTS